MRFRLRLCPHESISARCRASRTPCWPLWICCPLHAGEIHAGEIHAGESACALGQFAPRRARPERFFWRGRLCSRGSFCRSLHFFCDWLRVAPATAFGNELVSFGRAPTIWRILVNRRSVSQNRIDNAPSSFDAILANKEHRVASDGVAEEAFVRRHLVARRLPDDELHRFASHGLSGFFDSCTQRNRYIGTETKPKIIRLALRNYIEDRLRGALEFNEYFGCRDRHLLSRPNVERNAAPSRCVDV